MRRNYRTIDLVYYYKDSQAYHTYLQYTVPLDLTPKQNYILDSCTPSSKNLRPTPLQHANATDTRRSFQ